MEKSFIFHRWVMLIITLLAFSHISEAGDSMPAATGIEVTKWLLVEVSKAPVSTLAGGKQPHILFDPAQKKITGFAGCNQKGGTYSAGEKSLSIEITHSTMAACREGSLEEEFVHTLSAAAIYVIKDGDLTIDLKCDTGTMRFSTQQQK